MYISTAMFPMNNIVLQGDHLASKHYSGFDESR